MVKVLDKRVTQNIGNIKIELSSIGKVGLDKFQRWQNEKAIKFPLMGF